MSACTLVGAEIDYDRLERNLTRAEFLDQVKSISQEEATNELRSLAVARPTAEVSAVGSALAARAPRLQRRR